jgi:hypothetical protein
MHEATTDSKPIRTAGGCEKEKEEATAATQQQQQQQRGGHNGQ